MDFQVFRSTSSRSAQFLPNLKNIMSITSRRKKERKDQFREEIQIQEKEESSKIRPSDFICFVGDLPDLKTEVLLFVRVSSKNQEHNGNLKRQENAILKMIPENAKVVKTLKHQGSAKPEKIKDKLEEVMEHAKNKNVKNVVAITTSRFIRNAEHDATDPEKRNVMPNEDELKWLKNMAERYGVNLVTLADPDLSPMEDASFISNAIKRNEGKEKTGRPKKQESGYKIKQKEEWFAEVCRLHYQNRWSTRRIASHVTKESGIKISHETINQWIKESRME